MRLAYVSTKELRFPTPASNKLRGLIGRHLWRRNDSSYEKFFTPIASEGPSGLLNLPRPFVLRSRHLDGAEFPEGSEFYFDLHLFDLRHSWAEALEESLTEVGTARLTRVECERIEVSLDPGTDPLGCVTVQFLTPTELKAGGELVEKPEFCVLAARLRDRLSTLINTYGEEPFAMDFAAFGERASHVRMTRCEVTHIDANRRSGTSGQVHPLGGFVGEAAYQGDLPEFVPFLRAAEWTGVGRQTTWGKGEILVDAIE
jgi:hypothetical protein